ncbi:exodeoxyribonuclease VIII, partial [Escherichia coli]
MEFFYVVRATQKSGKQDAVVWFTAKTEARANLMLDVALEDAGIETGRGKDYAKPIRTDFPVVDDLPEEGAVDYTWCERYELQNDDRTWLPKVTAENSDEKTAQTVDSHITTESTLPETAGITLDEHDDDSTLYPVVQMPFRKQLLSQFTADELRHHVTREEYEAIGALEMDTDNSYVQNLLLAAENCPEVKGYDTKDLWRYTDAIRKVFSQDKRHELALVLRFTRMWAATDYIDRGILAREWAAGNHISSVQRTDAGTNADGGYVTDRGEGAHHTLDTLDLEIACALLPMDFNHLEIPGSIHRRAKEIVAKKEEPWKSWSALLRNQPGVLSVNRAAIFNLVRIAPENIHRTPAAHLEFVNQTMTAEFNAATELMPLRASAVQTQVEVEEPTAQPQVANLGGGMFSINGLLSGNTNPVINIPSNEAEKPETVVETTSDVQMEATQPEKDKTVDTVPPGESADATDPQTDTLNPAEVLSAAAPELANATTQELTTEASEEKASAPEEQPSQPVPEYPAYFEPGRYEGCLLYTS